MESKDKVSVLYIITKLELGGAQKICLSLMEGLAKQGHHVGLISGDQGPLVDQTKNFQSIFLLDSFKREVSFAALFGELKTFFSMIRYIRQYKKKYPHLVIHTHSTKAGILGRWAAFCAGVKKRVHTIHGFGFHEYQSPLVRNIIIFLEYLTSFITSHYICVSQKDQEGGIKYFPNFKEKSSLIRAAVAWDTFFIPAQKIKTPDAYSFTVGTISCFKSQKNLLDLFKAFKLVVQRFKEKPSTRVVLQVIGDGGLRKELESWIAQNNMTHAIQLLGWQHETAPWLRRWDLFAMSSLWEGLPCAIIEARLSRLPIIAYNVGGIAEVIFTDKNGFLIEPGKWQELAEKIIELIADQNRYLSMRLFNDEFTDFNDTIMIQKHISLYQSMLCISR